MRKLALGILALLAISLGIRLLLKTSLGPQVDWRQVTLEGVASGTSLNQIKAKLGPCIPRDSNQKLPPGFPVYFSIKCGRAELSGSHLELGGQLLGQAEPLFLPFYESQPPGGWRILGRSDVLRLFGPTSAPDEPSPYSDNPWHSLLYATPQGQSLRVITNGQDVAVDMALGWPTKESETDLEFRSGYPEPPRTEFPAVGPGPRPAPATAR